MFHLLWSMGLLRLHRGGLLFLLRLVHLPAATTLVVVCKGRTPAPVVSMQVGVIVKEVWIAVIVTVMLITMLVASIVGPPVLLRCSMPIC